jgi:hypothetical protein
MAKAIVIPVEGPVEEIDIPDDGVSSLETLQRLVGGHIEAIHVPEQFGGDDATAYINEEGKFIESCKPNMRATDFFVPGFGLFPGDYIAGTVVLVGFTPSGDHKDVPEKVIRRARLIEREAGY